MIILDCVAVAYDANLVDEEDVQMGTDWNINMDTDMNMETDADDLAWTGMQSNQAVGEYDRPAQEQSSTSGPENTTALSDVQLQMYSVLEAVERGDLSPDDAARRLDALDTPGESDAGEQGGSGQDTSTD